MHLHLTTMVAFAIYVYILAALTPTISSLDLNPGNRQLPNPSNDFFRIPLKHIDSGKNLTKLEKMQRAVQRKRRTSRSNNDSPSVEVRSGYLEFLMNFTIGTPPVSYSLIMDTGSDLPWIKCQPCVNCSHQTSAIFDPRNSSTFEKAPCGSKACDALGLEGNCKNGCDCEYSVSYGDTSSSLGVLAFDTLTFHDASIPNFAFGCGNDNYLFDQDAGLVGLGRGSLSLISQMNLSSFAHCFSDMLEEKQSTLILGSSSFVSASDTTLTTPLKNQNYVISLQGISIDGVRLNSTLEFEHVDLLVDTGTSYTYLDQELYELVKNQFKSLINLPVEESRPAGLDLCFILPSEFERPYVPKLVFHFEGGDMELPQENYMIIEQYSGLMCLAMETNDSILGVVQQQNMFVEYDLQKETISFTHTKCDQL